MPSLKVTPYTSDGDKASKDSRLQTRVVASTGAKVMGDDEIIKDFLIESHENLDRLDQELVTLERDPRDRETLASVFRTIHSIKGTSGFLAFNQLQALTHTGENLLARLRDGLLELTPGITTGLLAMVDAVRQMLAHIESEGSEGVRDDHELIETLTHLLNDGEMAVGSAAPEQAKALSAAEPPRRKNIGDILVENGAVTAGEVQAAVAQQDAGDPRHLGEILVERGVVKPQDVVEALQQQGHGPSASESTIRVDVAQLDRLMNRVGELVLLRNQILQYTSGNESSELQSASQRLNLLTTELQEGVMKTRMQPIGNIWSKFPRTLRDVAASCGKQVRIEMEGKETELDKTIIEAIKDPLTHLVRNAVDHGIESPDVRRAAGKAAEGRLLLRAFHEGGQVNIEISDDGAGLDLQRISNKGIQKGMITADQAERMTEREITNLIFMPGFSTAATVTNVSGRGVGMDVVKTNIDKIGGTVDVHSRPGNGCTVRLKIPLTLAIIPALTVKVAGDRYAIPQVSLLELVRLEGEQLQHGIESINGVPVHRLRGKLLPLVSLDRELRVREAAVPATNGKRQAVSVNIVVLRADGQRFGMVVDEINDTEEIVVKPLSKQLKSASTYAGATIMGDGKVALILDILGLAQKARVLGDTASTGFVESNAEAISTTHADPRRSLLLFEYGTSGRMAMDLSAVARLEEFPREKVEFAANQAVVQYRGALLPLVNVSDILEGGNPATTAQDPVRVVVHSDRNRSVGLIVDRIVDIVEESFVLQRGNQRSGILGSAVIQKRVTDVLDLSGLLTASGASLLGPQAPA